MDSIEVRDEPCGGSATEAEGVAMGRLRCLGMLGLLFLTGCAGTNHGLGIWPPSLPRLGGKPNASPWAGDPYSPASGSADAATALPYGTADSRGKAAEGEPARPTLGLHRPNSFSRLGAEWLAAASQRRGRPTDMSALDEQQLTVLPVALTVHVFPDEPAAASLAERSAPNASTASENGAPRDAIAATSTPVPVESTQPTHQPPAQPERAQRSAPRRAQAGLTPGQLTGLPATLEAMPEAAEAWAALQAQQRPGVIKYGLSVRYSAGRPLPGSRHVDASESPLAPAEPNPGRIVAASEPTPAVSLGNREAVAPKVVEAEPLPSAAEAEHMPRAANVETMPRTVEAEALPPATEAERTSRAAEVEAMPRAALVEPRPRARAVEPGPRESTAEPRPVRDEEPASTPGLELGASRPIGLPARLPDPAFPAAYRQADPLQATPVQEFAPPEQTKPTW